MMYGRFFKHMTAAATIGLAAATDTNEKTDLTLAGYLLLGSAGLTLSSYCLFRYCRAINEDNQAFHPALNRA